MARPRNTLEEHRERLRAIVERDFGASLMNSTKWMEALTGLKQFGLQYRAKLITADEPTHWGWLSSGPEDRLPVGWVEGCVGSPVLTLEIEWLELTTVSGTRPGQSYRGKLTDHTADIEQHLTSVGVPFTHEGTAIRIWGHCRLASPSPRDDAP